MYQVELLCKYFCPLSVCVCNYPLGCRLNFWGVEEPKPAWWPNRIKFQSISKTDLTKNALIDILISNMEHSNIPIAATNEHTSEEVVDNSIKSNKITSTHKRACTHSLIASTGKNND